MSTCSCGNYLDSKDKYCRECGERTTFVSHACGNHLDSKDKYCRECGERNTCVSYAVILTCDCCGDDLDRAKTCKHCGATRTCATKEGFNDYCERNAKIYKEISKKESILRRKNGALQRLKWNLEHPSGPECTCSATSICGTHDNYD